MTDRPPDSRFGRVLEEYESLEPPGADTWNPLHTDRELVHRLALYEQLCKALSRCTDVGELQVLDVGCGNGRSTRVYLDFGLQPEQLTGVDLRPAAVAMAKKLHPAIRCLVYDGEVIPLADESVNWASICTVMSSIAGTDSRRHLAAEVIRVLAPGGHLFLWDRITAQEFAGGDPVEPNAMFPELQTVYEEGVCPYGRVDRLLEGRVVSRTLLPLVRMASPPKTHFVCLLRKT